MNVLLEDHATLGTPHYMAPEQWQDSKMVDQVCDIWSVGVILYQMLTKKLPYSGYSGANIIYAILTQEVTPPHQICKEQDPLAQLIEPICLKALEKEKENRFQSAQEMVLAIEGVIKKHTMQKN